VGTYKSIKSKVLGMDVLVVLGTTAAYTYALLSIITAATTNTPSMGEHFLETSAVLICFVLLGKYMQASATARTSVALEKLNKLTPSTATLVTRKKNLSPNHVWWGLEDTFLSSQVGGELDIDTKLLHEGDIIKVIRGSAIPCDGALVSDSSLLVNEAAITGESVPVLKLLNVNCIAGTIVTEGFGYIRVESIGADTAVSKIVEVRTLIDALANTKR